MRTERARHFARRGQRQSFDQIEPKAGIACPLIEFDPRYASVPKIFAEHYTLDSADAFLVRLNVPLRAPNKCELLHTARNFFCGPGSQVAAAGTTGTGGFSATIMLRGPSESGRRGPRGSTLAGGGRSRPLRATGNEAMYRALRGCPGKAQLIANGLVLAKLRS